MGAEILRAIRLPVSHAGPPGQLADNANLDFDPDDRTHRMNSFPNAEHPPTGKAPNRAEELVSDFLRTKPLPRGPRQKFAMLPFAFIADLYELLSTAVRIRLLDFSQLPFSPSVDIRTEAGLHALYKQEFEDWRRSLPAANAQCNILIQHDSDDGPAETEYMCLLESILGIRSTTAIFARKVSSSGEESEYSINFDLLKRLQTESRMCFAYHCNAAEVARYDESRIASVFDEDVDFLRSKGLDIRFFSPHGGVLSSTGKNNNSYFYPALSRDRLIWTHNRFAPTGARYSDGSWIGRINKPNSGLDLRAFLLNRLQDPGLSKSRSILLLHPQYYFAADVAAAAPHFATNPWLEEYWALYSQGKQKDYWQPLRRALEQIA